MSLITIGLVRSVRSEVKISSLDRQKVQAQAMGEAAIALAAQQWPVIQRENPTSAISNIQTQFEGYAISVRIQSLTGLINPNFAPLELLAKMFENTGGLSQGAAQEMALRVVQWRSEVGDSGVQRGVEVPEDLLQVPGFTYDLYARVASLLTTSVRSSNLDVNSSPPEVLAMLGLEPQSPGSNQARAQSPFLRFTATVEQGQTQFEVIRDMRVGSSPSRSGLYWHILNSQQHVAHPSL
nr:general secretion pathway protein GspK [Lampropedia puyangensis]